MSVSSASSVAPVRATRKRAQDSSYNDSLSETNSTFSLSRTQANIASMRRGFSSASATTIPGVSNNNISNGNGSNSNGNSNRWWSDEGRLFGDGVVVCLEDELPGRTVGREGKATGLVINDVIRVGLQIGKGSYGEVYMCYATDAEAPEGSPVGVGADDKSKDDMAIKIVSLERFEPSSGVGDRIKREIYIMSLLDHPNIISLRDAWSTDSQYFLLMDLAAHGDVFDIVAKHSRGIPEPLCARIMFQLLSALAFMKEKGVAHRDIKPENLFIDDQGCVKLGDFGLASVVPTSKDGEKLYMSTCCGSVTYQAPEMVIDKCYGIEVDMWSAGLTMFTLLTGRDPWRKVDTTTSSSDIRERIRAGSYNCLPSHVSGPARELVARMITVDPDARITPREALKHHWLKHACI